MSRTKLWIVVNVMIVASMLLTACQPETQTVVQTVVVKEPGQEKVTVKEVVVTVTPQPTKVPEKPNRPNKITYNTNTGDVPSIDPNVAQDNSSITIIEASFVGLTRMNEVTAELEPGMAPKWDVSEDGKTYTFHLRNDVPWVRWNGQEVEKVLDCEGNERLVTARDFEYGIIRALKPETASPYAYVLAFVVEGAADFNNGVTDDPATIGVKALDDWTLEVKFLDDTAYNVNIIGLWTAMPVPQWVIEGSDCSDPRSDRWTEPGFFQSYGPFTLKEWIHDSTLTIVKNPYWPGCDSAPQAQLDEVTFTMLDDSAALAEYESGGNMQFTRMPLADMDRVKADPVLSKELYIGPSMSTYYYGFNTKAPIVNDVRVRRALSMAVDRQSLVDNVTKGGQIPAQWFARPGLTGAPTMETHPDLGIKHDPETAKKLLDEYLAETGQTVDQLDLTLMFNTSSGHQKIAEAIQQMWKDVLGLNVKLTNQEWKVFLVTVKSPETPQIYRSGWGMDYPDTNNFLREVVGSGGSDNPVQNGEPYGGLSWKNDTYEELVKQAAVEKDPDKRRELYAQAEQILVYEDAAMIPLYWYTSVQITKPYVKRTYAVSNERLEKWSIVQD